MKDRVLTLSSLPRLAQLLLGLLLLGLAATSLLLALALPAAAQSAARLREAEPKVARLAKLVADSAGLVRFCDDLRLTLSGNVADSANWVLRSNIRNLAASVHHTGGVIANIPAPPDSGGYSYGIDPSATAHDAWFYASYYASLAASVANVAGQMPDIDFAARDFRPPQPDHGTLSLVSTMSEWAKVQLNVTSLRDLGRTAVKATAQFQLIDWRGRVGEPVNEEWNGNEAKAYAQVGELVALNVASM